MDERREFRRIGYAAKAEIRGSNVNWFTNVVDLSLKGVRVRRPEHWSGNLNNHYTLVFPIDEDHMGVQLQLVGRVIDQDEYYVGLSIENIDLDSLSHLIRLIELNLGDPELMQEELLKLEKTSPKTQPS